VKVAVPVTVPEGWVGRAEVSVRVKVQGVASALKSCSGVGGAEERDGGSVGEASGVVVVSEEGLGVWLSKRTALTLWRVARLGFRAGLLVVIQLSLCLMKSFVMVLVLTSPAILPWSSAARHNKASAAPTERSLPVGQHMRMFFEHREGSEDKNSVNRGSCVRRSRDPSFPSWHFR